ncbi:MAG: hypothetical protein AMXMBFR34_51890 [Myxococcaceae bacterium]
MVIKSVDSKRSVPTPSVSSARVEAPALPAVAQQPAVDSGFQSAKQKLVNMTGRHKPVAMAGDAALAGSVAAQLRVAQAGGVGGTTVGKGKPKVDAAVTDFLKEACRQTTGDLKQAYADLKKAVDAGDWGTAAKKAKALLSGKADDQAEAIDEALGLSGTKSTEALIAQLDFLSKLEAAGVKADCPPTEAQLVQYFGTLKKDPRGAREAFAAYAEAFHVHPADAGQGDRDIAYTKGDSRVPESWGEVTGEKAKGQPAHLGKHVNDCEGYAFLAETLLGAAGFTVAHHLTTHGGPAGDHGMVSFKHPQEKGYTLTSNGHVLTGKDERALAIEGFNQASPKPATKDLRFYTGATMLESQERAGAHDKKHSV